MQVINNQPGIGAKNLQEVVGYETFDPNNQPGEYNNIYQGTTYKLTEADDTNNDGVIQRDEAITAGENQLAIAGYPQISIENLFDTTGTRVDANIYSSGALDAIPNMDKTYQDGDFIHFTLKDVQSGENIDGAFRGRFKVDFSGLNTVNLQNQQSDIHMTFNSHTEKLIINSHQEIKTLQIFSADGRLIEQHMPTTFYNGHTEIPTLGLPKGIYFVTGYYADGTSFSYKIIIKP